MKKSNARINRRFRQKRLVPDLLQIRLSGPAMPEPITAVIEIPEQAPANRP
jgi:hypothetical protein